ncbi:hypothetical protein EZV62_008508 [Acer yangbiense]|uniref:Leucine-rich repeat-containing N-terminal plant-type domain-containing protein n=1 Tax=Acer yangbiense TaxID=1000413 RepID=A0A5C7ID28_9ROSI|nr:hypothetical protein EZV62_008508 [Acer yangbiense]
MVSRSSAHKVMVMWTIVASFTNIFAATSESSDIRLEREALLKSGWWSKINNPVHHCNWIGITCNQATSISLFGSIGKAGELGQFNFSRFPNLEYFNVFYNNLSGTIPAEVGALSKFVHLDLSYNNLTGKHYTHLV